MKSRFRIESTFKIRGKVYVMIKSLSDGIFKIESNLSLDGIPIDNWITEVNHFENEDNFIISLKNSGDENLIHVGKEVELAKNHNKIANQ